ncbi:FMN reductase [Rhodoplanes serenus]|uniref:FMN reductase n=1 Tax=Rhodoplanes serenus TaxID=200615 RepID=A0A9X4XJQ8_9BRAD|nr:NAD(P)H-dependent oxidoreductase [Rhodoplanes serenus]MTW16452.1 FMN reductase [Rhodoplanes serenus]
MLSTPAAKSAITERSERRPFILGIGGTPRERSSTELALRVSLAAAAANGAGTMLLGGRDLLLPLYQPGPEHQTPQSRRLVDALRRCDGLVIASPSYHGAMSGLIKNALDYTEEVRGAGRTYLDGIAVGLIACAGGSQGAGQTLAALRGVAHALRGWPTPFGAAICTTPMLFDADGACLDLKTAAQLELVGRQVLSFARMNMAAGDAAGR